MRVALLQLGFTLEKSENLRKIITRIRELPRNVDVVVLPEYSMGHPSKGPDPEHVRKVSEPIEGSFVSELAGKAREMNLWIIANIYEQFNGEFYDTCVAINRKGEVASVYRKIHLFDALGFSESSIFKAGESIATFELDGMEVGMAICFDLRFPEIFRAMALRGAEVFIVPSAWFRGPEKEWHWKVLCCARASENVAYLIGVNNASEAFIGRSLFVNPYGVVVKELGAGDETAVVEIDKSEIESTREKLPLLRLRRSELYGP